MGNNALNWIPWWGQGKDKELADKIIEETAENLAPELTYNQYNTNIQYIKGEQYVQQITVDGVPVQLHNTTGGSPTPSIGTWKSIEPPKESFWKSSYGITPIKPLTLDDLQTGAKNALGGLNNDNITPAPEPKSMEDVYRVVDKKNAPAPKSDYLKAMQAELNKKTALSHFIDIPDKPVNATGYYTNYTWKGKQVTEKEYYANAAKQNTINPNDSYIATMKSELWTSNPNKLGVIKDTSEDNE